MDEERVQRWARWEAAQDSFDVAANEDKLAAIIEAIRSDPHYDGSKLTSILRLYPRDGGGVFAKEHLVRAYRALCAAGRFAYDRETHRRLQMKPVRTGSGVAPVAVMTKPHPCPGECIFCPSNVHLPKSYLPDEPGALRAMQNECDPHRQTASRIASLDRIGHSTDKIELLILGGTWSAYPRSYREWFVQRCLDAVNDRDSSSLLEAQHINETAPRRNVGLVIETRPDSITLDEVRHLRYLGVTKVQLGAQSMDDAILRLNKRGHHVEATRRAVGLLRLAGFKIHLHWMPNLLGATPQSDREDFQRLWADPGIRPDELKIYPTAVLAGTELHEHWQRGHYRPYETSELVDLIVDCKQMVPPYCRLTRIIRDIPAADIVAGNKQSNLRQTVQHEMRRRDLRCRCIRCREVGTERTNADDLALCAEVYQTTVSEEHFLSFVSPGDRLAAFLRLSLPHDHRAPAELFPELAGCAMIREVHVYGPALDIGSASEGEAQHSGLGTRLIEQAEEIARAHGYGRLAVISAIGTRAYYRRFGFKTSGHYMVKDLLSGVS